MSSRKLQLEIDRVLKKVAEGFNDFDTTYAKIQTTTNSNMSQKYEADLKKEIKKLQRCRDQIKTWLTSNEIKDKRQLTDSRKAIENKMEQFKLIEKEMKTKAFSKEGLNQATKIDPREQKKTETTNWISEVVDNLNIQIDSFEAESEVLLSGGKKGKKDAAKNERLSLIKHHVERHKWHINRLELVQRLLENDRVEADTVDDLKESIEYYVDSNQDPDFDEDEELYDELNLDEEEELYNVVTDERQLHALKKEEEEELNSLDIAISKRVEKQPAAKADTAKTKKEEKEPEPIKTTPQATPVTAAEVIKGVDKTPTNKPAELTPVAASTPAPVEPKIATMATPFAQAVAAKDPKITANKEQTPANKAQLTSSAPSTKASPAPSAPPALPKIQTTPNTPAAAKLPSQPASPMISAKNISRTSTPPGIPIPRINETNSNLVNISPALSKPPTEVSDMPNCLKDLLDSYDLAHHKNNEESSPMFHKLMLETSFNTIPDSLDVEPPAVPYFRERIVTSQHYPQYPLPNSRAQEFFNNLDVETLFFIFYYMDGTYEQYLCSKQLKSLNWRFHKRYNTWFQRKFQPDEVKDDHETGTYTFFDYERNWRQETKSNFQFYYVYLEE